MIARKLQPAWDAPDYQNQRIGSDSSNHPTQWARAIQEIQSMANEQGVKPGSFRIDVKPVQNGFFVTITHNNVTTERIVTDQGEIGNEIMAAIASINLGK